VHVFYFPTPKIASTRIETYSGCLHRGHHASLKSMAGVPGTLPSRFEEAKRVRHCALSLVGEPIMYPEINELIKLMHLQGISTYLVTNAQFPDAIRNLTPVTQLYVSVDAAKRDELKAIDRPLFEDFWERLGNPRTFPCW